jgi:hypothetical protein
VLDGLRGEHSIAELCRREGIAESLYYTWSKEFLEAGKRRLAGDTSPILPRHDGKYQHERTARVDLDQNLCGPCRKRSAWFELEEFDGLQTPVRKRQYWSISARSGPYERRRLHSLLTMGVVPSLSVQELDGLLQTRRSKSLSELTLLF